jgi:hypothetical protein
MIPYLVGWTKLNIQLFRCSMAFTRVPSSFLAGNLQGRGHGSVGALALAGARTDGRPCGVPGCRDMSRNLETGHWWHQMRIQVLLGVQMKSGFSSMLSGTSSRRQRDFPGCPADWLVVGSNCTPQIYPNFVFLLARYSILVRSSHPLLGGQLIWYPPQDLPFCGFYWYLQ